MPWQDESAAPSQSGHGHGSRGRRSTPSTWRAAGPSLAWDCRISHSALPPCRTCAGSRRLHRRHRLVLPFHLRCSAENVGEDGQPLPPTKKQETSEAERKARRDALVVKFCAKQRLSLVKAMVVMESRNAHWRRIGALNPSNNKAAPTSFAQPQRDPSAPRKTNAVGPLPPMPNAWSLDIRHEQLDIAQIEARSKRRSSSPRSVPTPSAPSATEAASAPAPPARRSRPTSASGAAARVARSCVRKPRVGRCQGAGVLKCNTCKGSLQSACRSCEGTGTGEYGFYVDVTVKRVEMPPSLLPPCFPSLTLLSGPVEPSYDDVKAAAKLALWDSITKLTEARRAVARARERICACDGSVHVGELDDTRRIGRRAAGGQVQEGCYSGIEARRTPPQDCDAEEVLHRPHGRGSRPIELSEEQVRKLGAPESSVSPSRREAARRGRPHEAALP